MLLGVVDEVSAGLVRIPVEVAAEAAVFRVVARGYDPGQVDAHVLALEQELAELRWEHDDLAAQRRELAEQREQQDRWRPSVRALGDRMVQLMCLAEQEAGALRTAATVEVARQREQANVAFAAQQAEQARALQVCHEAAEREMRPVHSLHQNRREVLARSWPRPAGTLNWRRLAPSPGLQPRPRTCGTRPAARPSRRAPPPKPRSTTCSGAETNW